MNKAVNVLMKNLLKNRQKNSLNIFIACLFFLFACQSSADMRVEIKSETKIFSFSLDANPTTGFQWVLKDFDRNKIKFIKKLYQAQNTKLIGSGGKDTFIFKVLNPKSHLDTRVRLSYERSWEKNQNNKVQVVHIYTVK
jgi:inhibitor of cysteine peptidase